MPNLCKHPAGTSRSGGFILAASAARQRRCAGRARGTAPARGRSRDEPPRKAPASRWPRGATLKTPTTASIVSFRLGGPDGVSVEAAKWSGALEKLGISVQTVAGGGTADVVVGGLDIEDPDLPDERALARSLAPSDLVIVENSCSLPLNPAASATIARQLRGRRAILHHHDLPWQRRHLSHLDGWPPDDPAWLHVTINELSRRELAARGVHAVTVYNSFDTEALHGRRAHARRLLGVGGDERLVLQPTRAIARKNIPMAVRLAEALGATYWLTGPAEDGYGPELLRVLGDARCPVLRGLPGDLDLPDAYAAADVIAFPSTWEGFGNPLIEAAVQRRPLAVGDYPVLDEVGGFGFRWFAADEPAPLRHWLEHPDPAVLDVNERLARRHFSLASLPLRLAEVLLAAGWGDLLGTEHVDELVDELVTEPATPHATVG
jgi:glycosyltransferase involved in cell wall biosynthesis